MNVGGAYYVAKRWKDSAEFLESKIRQVDNETQSEFFRTLLLNYAYLNNYDKFKKTLKRSVKKLEQASSNNIDTTVSLSEAMSRSFSIFGLTKESKKVFRNIEELSPSPFYQSQIIRGKMYTCLADLKKTGKSDIDLVNQLRNKAAQKKYKIFKRHQKQIKSMLKTINKVIKK